MKKNLLQKDDEKKFQLAVGHELYASNFYKYCAGCLQKQGWFGSQKYFEKESADELVHYYKLRDFLNDRGSEAEMPEVPEAEIKDETLAGIFSEAYTLELNLGTFYNDWYMSTKDATVHAFLQDMVTIQRVSIGEYGDLIARLERIGDALFDIEIGD